MAEFRDLVDSETIEDLGSPDAWIGRVVDDRYRVIEKVGEGGMGAVYAAEHLTLGKTVALKVILPQFSDDGAIAARFAREAMATGKLDHPHVASAMDYGSLPDGGAYLVMQLVRGVSLEEVLQKEGRISWPRACAIGAQVADALSAAHAEGIVHRDLKPENVMLEPRDDGSELVMVLDFGIAQLHGVADRPTGERVSEVDEVQSKQITRVGAVIGTPGYMAPEQALGEQVDPRADIYSLGVVLWEMVTGKTLFDSDEMAEIVRAQISGDATPRMLSESRDETFPDELQQLVDHLLCRQPVDRPENAATVRDVLRDLALRATVEGDPRARVSTLSRYTPATGLERVSRPEVPVLSKLFGSGRPGWRVVLAGAVATLVLSGIMIAVVVALKDEPAVQPVATAEDEAEQMENLLEATRREAQLDLQIDVLLNEPQKDVREIAAQWILEYEPASDVEPYLRALASLSIASGCSELEIALHRIMDLNDPRTRASVQRLEDTPRTCRGRRRGRRIRTAHCYACVRSELRQILEMFPETPEEPMVEEGAPEGPAPPTE